MRIRIHSHDFRHHKEKLFTEVQIWHNKNLNKIDSLRLSENALCLMNKTNKCYASSDSFRPTTFKFRFFCYRTRVRNTWLVMVFFLLFQFKQVGKGTGTPLGHLQTADSVQPLMLFHKFNLIYTLHFFIRKFTHADVWADFVLSLILT